MTLKSSATPLLPGQCLQLHIPCHPSNLLCLPPPRLPTTTMRTTKASTTTTAAAARATNQNVHIRRNKRSKSPRPPQTGGLWRPRHKSSRHDWLTSGSTATGGSTRGSTLPLPPLSPSTPSGPCVRQPREGLVWYCPPQWKEKWTRTGAFTFIGENLCPRPSTKSRGSCQDGLRGLGRALPRLQVVVMWYPRLHPLSLSADRSLLLRGVVSPTAKEEEEEMKGCHWGRASVAAQAEA